MRIVAGKFRGKNLAKSEHLKSLRPTTDKSRQALFNILSSAKFIKEIGFEIDGSRIVDLCCGSGAVAFEALSRGAKSAVLIDNNRKHLELAKANSELLKVGDVIEILCYDAKRLPENNKGFDLIFIDPPYDEDYPEIIKRLKEKNWLSEKTLIVVELSSKQKQKLKNLDFLRQLDLRIYGGTAFIFCVIN